MGIKLLLQKQIWNSVTPIVQTERIDREHLHNLFITTGASDIEIGIHDKPYIEVVLETNEDGPQLFVNEENNKVTIETKLQNNKKYFAFSKMNYSKLHVSVPKEMVEKWNVCSQSGDIEMNAINTNQAVIKTSSGNIEVAHVNAEKINLSSSSGEIRAQFIKTAHLLFNLSSGDVDIRAIEGNITGCTSSGEIEVSNSKGSLIELRASSGVISISDSFMERGRFSTGSGNIVANEIDSDNIRFQTGSGDVKLSNYSGDVSGDTGSGDVDLKMLRSGNLALKTGSGDIMIKIMEEPISARLQIKTGSGNISSNLPLIFKSRSNCYGQAGDDIHQIHLYSGSGDIEVYSIKQ